jgi:Neuraminidase (sialidase)
MFNESTHFYHAVRVVTNDNINLSGLFTIDRESLVSGDLVFVRNQRNDRENGLYICSEGSWDQIDLVDNYAFLVIGGRYRGFYWFSDYMGDGIENFWYIGRGYSMVIESYDPSTIDDFDETFWYNKE